MKNVMSLIEQLNWGIVVVLCATLGLAPFTPPHIVEKISMLVNGDLIKPMDWFDLLFHGFPWIILFLKFIPVFMKKT